MQDNCTSDTSESSYDWLPHTWFCGMPGERCHFCGLPILFAPDCLGVEACGCGRADAGQAAAEGGAMTAVQSRTIVRFGRPVIFSVRLGTASLNRNKPSGSVPPTQQNEVKL